MVTWASGSRTGPRGGEQQVPCEASGPGQPEGKVLA